MDYQTAYERLCAAVWKYDKVHNDAYVQLMLTMREIDGEANKLDPFILLAGDRAREPEE